MALEVAPNIRLARKRKRLTQSDVAERLGMAQASYQRYESGLTDLTVSRINEVAEAIGVDVSELLGIKPTVVTASDLPAAVYLLIPMQVGANAEILQTIQQLINKLT
jgi:transcriptional regulator with XRE-family HTH domain